MIDGNFYLYQICACLDVTFGDFPLRHLPSCLLFCDKLAVDGFQDPPYTSPSSTRNVSTTFSSVYTEVEESNQSNQEFKQVKLNKWKQQKFIMELKLVQVN